MGCWKKTDFHYVPSRNLLWARSHATVPTAFHLEGDLFRVFYSTRDEKSRNTVGWIDMYLADDIRVLEESDKPVIDLGKPGYFDCDGIYATCLVPSHEGLRFYYAGWNAGRDGYFYSAIGVAISDDGGLSFRRVSHAPILGRDEIDPWACMAPYVLQGKDGIWRMWYASGIELKRDSEGVLRSLYDIKTATSLDGFSWKKSGKTAIDLGENDTNIARACVVQTQHGYKAWYPYVSRKLQQYRIGYGESSDGESFIRMDASEEADIQPTGNPNDWDGLAVTYPYVFEHRNRQYMLYNGNEFGKTGFGIAVWENE